MPIAQTSPTAEEMGALFDAHVGAEFDTKDLAATMATMSEHPHLTHVPVLTGGTGREEIAHFYGTYFIGHWPQDTEVTPISRTIGQGRVVDEFVLSFTHDVEMPAIVPGIAPTGRKVEIPFIVIMGMAGGQGHLRAHLLGPGLDLGAARRAGTGQAASFRRRAGAPAAGPDPAGQHPDPEGVRPTDTLPTGA